MTRPLAVLGFALSACAAQPPTPPPEPPAPPAPGCGADLAVQVLGSGGPELAGGRASASYVVWKDGAARVLVDAGAGSALRFGESGARWEDLDLVLITHLHVDHVADLDAFVKRSYFGERDRPLPILGPPGNALVAGLAEHARLAFGADAGSFRYLGRYLDPARPYHLAPTEIPVDQPPAVVAESPWKVTAVGTPHGDLPNLAYRLDVDGRSIVFSSDTSAVDDRLVGLATGADLLVAHHAIPEEGADLPTQLHMKPSRVGEVAAAAGVGSLVLSHRMARTIGQEASSEAAIRKNYAGPVAFADDLDCFPVGGP